MIRLFRIRMLFHNVCVVIQVLAQGNLMNSSLAILWIFGTEYSDTSIQR